MTAPIFGLFIPLFDYQLQIIFIKRPAKVIGKIKEGNKIEIKYDKNPT